MYLCIVKDLEVCVTDGMCREAGAGIRRQLASATPFRSFRPQQNKLNLKLFPATRKPNLEYN